MTVDAEHLAVTSGRSLGKTAPPTDLDSAEAWGVRSQRLSDGASDAWFRGSWSLGTGALPQQVCIDAKPVALPIPYAYDANGIAWPSDRRVMVGGLQNQRSYQFLSSILWSSGFPVALPYKHFRGRRGLAYRVAEGETVTIELWRTATWSTIGTPSTFIDSATSPPAGPDGIVTWALPEVSIDADRRTTGHIYIKVTTSDGIVAQVVAFTTDEGIIRYGQIVPTSLTSGFTRNDLDHTNWRASPNAQPGVRWQAAQQRDYGVHVLMRGYNRDVNASGDTVFTETARYPSLPRRLGLAEWNVKRERWATSHDSPLIWDGSGMIDTNINHGVGQLCTYLRSALSADHTEAGSGSGTITAGPTAITNQGGPGYRNVRVWAYGAIGNVTGVTVRIKRTADWLAGTPTVTLATFSWSAAEALDAEGVPQDVADLIPASGWVDNVVLYMEIDLSYSGTGYHSIGVEFGLTPRDDISPAWPVPCVDNTLIPGGYLASEASAPDNRLVPAEAADGDTTVGTTLVAGAVRDYSVRFRPPSDGLWKIVFSPSSSPMTIGNYEFGYQRRNAELGRAGKNFWGHSGAYFSFSGGAATWTLSAVTVTPVTVSSGGTAVSSGPESFHWFGTFTPPAAGTYRVWVKINAYSPSIHRRLVLFASQASKYVFEDETDLVTSRRSLFCIAPIKELDATTPPGSPAGSVLYILADAGCTGAWAGHEGYAAQWDTTYQTWKFWYIADTPVAIGGRDDRAGAAFSDFLWYDPTTDTWLSQADEFMELRITVPDTNPVYLRFGMDDQDQLLSVNNPMTFLVTASVGWEAV